MRRYAVLSIGLLAATLLSACGDNTTETFRGVITSRTTQTVTVTDPTDHTVVQFTLGKADTTHAYGLLAGNRIEVEYRGTLRPKTAARRVTTDATYARAVGIWALPDPAHADSIMGFRLMPEGRAASIRLSTIRYTSWQQQGDSDTLLLHGTGNGRDTLGSFTQRAWFGTDTLGRPALLLEGSPLALTKR